MITQELLKELNSGKIFTAVFKKKDGSIRTMNCRMNVAKYVNGKGLAFNPMDKGLLPVFDLQKDAYRFVNLNALISLTVKGKTYEFSK